MIDNPPCSKCGGPTGWVSYGPDARGFWCKACGNKDWLDEEIEDEEIEDDE
jgi:tRNA(Ile2) C34 agmatinyltransferase TiaS